MIRMIFALMMYMCVPGTPSRLLLLGQRSYRMRVFAYDNDGWAKRSCQWLLQETSFLFRYVATRKCFWKHNPGLNDIIVEKPSDVEMKNLQNDSLLTS